MILIEQQDVVDTDNIYSGHLSYAWYISNDKLFGNFNSCVSSILGMSDIIDYSLYYD